MGSAQVGYSFVSGVVVSRIKEEFKVKFFIAVVRWALL